MWSPHTLNDSALWYDIGVTFHCGRIVLIDGPFIAGEKTHVQVPLRLSDIC